MIFLKCSNLRTKMTFGFRDSEHVAEAVDFEWAYDPDRDRKAVPPSLIHAH